VALGQTLTKLDRIFLIITSYCNSRCILCNYWRKKEKHFLPFSFIYKEIVPLIYKYKIKVVCITGGEPTLHPNLSQILKVIKKTGTFITLITNCVKLNSIFKEIRHYVDGYMLPLDGDTSTLHYEIRGINNFQDIINWPRKIKVFNPSAKVILSCLIQKKNVSKLVNIYQLASKLPIDGIVFRVPELKPYCFGRSYNIPDESQKNAYLTKKDIKTLEKNFEEILTLDSKKKILLQRKSVFQKFIKYFEFLNGGEIEFGDRICRVPFNSITIDELKNIHPCFYLPFPVPFNKVKNDPINNFHLKNIRKKIIGNKKFRKKYCSSCLQFQR
jgi:MoaA/NifB/PqqE/SkfB family radical SAM enzyme